MRRMVNERIGGSHAGEAASERVPRLGVALLEVIVALAIFATAGVAALAMAAEITRVVRDAHAAEAELRDASAFLEAVVLWPRSDLDQRLGDRRQGPWLLRVERAAPEVYVITLRDSLGATTMLQTSIFRPGAFDDAD